MVQAQEKQISLDEIRRNIEGSEEFTFVIERKKIVDKKEVPDGSSVVIKMKSLVSEERSNLENVVKSRNIDATKEYGRYMEELRYVVLSKAIVSITLLTEKDGKKEEVKANLEDKAAVEKFLRGLTYYTVIALYTKYEDAAGQIFDDLKKKD